MESGEKKMGESHLKSDDNKAIDLSSVEQLKLTPEIGDMIVFAGGQIWHKVETVKGKKSRYRVGGFLTVSKDNKSLYF